MYLYFELLQLAEKFVHRNEIQKQKAIFKFIQI